MAAPKKDLPKKDPSPAEPNDAPARPVARAAKPSAKGAAKPQPRVARPNGERSSIGKLVGLFPIFVIIAGTLIGWSYWIWQRVEPVVLADPQYLLDPQQIEVTPTPEWIRANVKSEVLRDANLVEPLSMLDPELGEQLAGAFRFHPWVADARVTLTFPARAQIEVTYRRPAAVVAIGERNEIELIPVDAEGIRLPDADFSPDARAKLPRIDGIGTLPVAGQRASDLRVAGAARIAALLRDDWTALALERIVPLGSVFTTTAARPQSFQLFTRGGTSIHWGASPSDQATRDLVFAEPSGAVKRARLLAHVAQHGALDAADAPRSIDLLKLPDPPDSASR